MKPGSFVVSLAALYMHDAGVCGHNELLDRPASKAVVNSGVKGALDETMSDETSHRFFKEGRKIIDNAVEASGKTAACKMLDKLSGDTSGMVPLDQAN
jgi:hypothetical protein